MMSYKDCLSWSKHFLINLTQANKFNSHINYKYYLLYSNFFLKYHSHPLIKLKDPNAKISKPEPTLLMSSYNTHNSQFKIYLLSKKNSIIYFKMQTGEPKDPKTGTFNPKWKKNLTRDMLDLKILPAVKKILKLNTKIYL